MKRIWPHTLAHHISPFLLLILFSNIQLLGQESSVCLCLVCIKLELESGLWFWIQAPAGTAAPAAPSISSSILQQSATGYSVTHKQCALHCSKSPSPLCVCLFVCSSPKLIDGVAEMPFTQTSQHTDVIETHCACATAQCALRTQNSKNCRND